MGERALPHPVGHFHLTSFGSNCDCVGRFLVSLVPLLWPPAFFPFAASMWLPSSVPLLSVPWDRQSSPFPHPRRKEPHSCPPPSRKVLFLAPSFLPPPPTQE